MEHIVQGSGLTVDKLIRATPEGVRLAEKVAIISLTLTCGIWVDTEMMVNKFITTIRLRKLRKSVLSVKTVTKIG